MDRRLTVVAAVIIDRDRVLAARRPLHKSRGGLWEFPGGKVEPGEEEQDALVREIDEELGMTIRPTGLIGESCFDYPDLSIRLRAWRCERLGAAPLVLREHVEVRWLGADELDGLEWAPADVPLLAQVGASLVQDGFAHWRGGRS